MKHTTFKDEVWKSEITKNPKHLIKRMVAAYVLGATIVAGAHVGSQVFGEASHAESNDQTNSWQQAKKYNEDMVDNLNVQNQDNQ